MSLSLITKGMLCSKITTISNRYVLPYNLQIKDKTCLDLQVKEKENITLNASNVIDKQLNIKISEEQINVKKNLDDSINLSE